MREHAGVSREELKQSAAVTVAVLLAVGLIAAWNVLIPGVDAWENIVAAVIGSLRLTGPVAAAFAAWVALRKRRALRGRSLTTWRALKAPLAIVVVVLGSFAATVLVLAVKTVLTDQAGRLSLPGLGMGMAGLALYSVIGWVAGWVLPKAFTPPLAGLACYAAFSWLADDRGWADKLAPGTGEPYDLFQELSGAAFFDQTIWLLGLTAALLLGWAATVTRQALVLACALLAVLAAGMGVSRVLAQTRPAAAEDIAYACQDWPITVCVHPGMRAGLTELGAVFTQIAMRLDGTPAAFKRVEQRPLEEKLRPSLGLAPIHVPDLSAGFAEKAAYEYIESLSDPCPGTVTEGYREIVMVWLRGEPPAGGPLAEHQYATSWFSWLSEHQRREWLRMFYSDFRNCRLSSTHFGGSPARPQLVPQTVQPSPDSTHVYPVYPDPAATPAAPPASYGTPGTSGTAPSLGYAPEPAPGWVAAGPPTWSTAGGATEPGRSYGGHSGRGPFGWASHDHWNAQGGGPRDGAAAGQPATGDTPATPGPTTPASTGPKNTGPTGHVPTGRVPSSRGPWTHGTPRTVRTGDGRIGGGRTRTDGRTDAHRLRGEGWRGHQPVGDAMSGDRPTAAAPQGNRTSGLNRTPGDRTPGETAQRGGPRAGMTGDALPPRRPQSGTRSQTSNTPPQTSTPLQSDPPLQSSAPLQSGTPL
ncbi:hypothetical protein Nocox_08160 [Nonomuraea coxensis DSM 45129]|uniref:Uncharacterized protein n=1 Tax=Nonomuraea coxensis DSM 45129 TaxID=1122611 RepID=A0ABX8TV54_9ACTN|nr:hypothetical protein [Nonomuraea coxensis]QYC39257.1 hypothetical protein Nocox_08160 [Nonomuraea coxensis DSM 45129]